MSLSSTLSKLSPPGPGEFARYLRTETFGGVVLLVAAAAALLWANSPWSDSYVALRDAHVGTSFLGLDLTVGHWAQEAVLAVFFFVAGLELKREIVVGELSSLRQAALPIVAAVGGVVVPIGIFLAIAHGTPGADRAWAIPAATDIAFALGVLALVGSRIPSGARVFLLALAVVDDLIAIVIIAVVFTASINWWALAIAAAACAVYALAQRARIRSSFLYVPLAVVTWIAMYQAGIHATIAGVALGLLTRVRTDPGEECSPAGRLEHRIQPISAAVCVPLFALFAAGVPLTASALGDLTGDRIAIGIAVGLVVGKTIGIFGVSFVAIRMRWVARPDGLSLRDMLAISILGGIGFTVSLLIAELALPPGEADAAKAAVLLSSMAASLVGAAALIRRGRVHAALDTAGT
ncbi:Na+/H+ antiporter NhaA [Williamsia serinedens]|uniref:Na(+)/H(+) antiporter NhaA n=1 Tax=Williamsia serinedens TaxID=391736 RepID=A0ABT1H4R9_9NOCA|nr:Na+/H+ antiporter NhaA [Williamsia serinedens]MCP2162230.1 sodium/proton antiporter, NhaA family (TC 2.A.33.1.1) [Williamsia serinedens]